MRLQNSPTEMKPGCFVSLVPSHLRIMAHGSGRERSRGQSSSSAASRGSRSNRPFYRRGRWSILRLLLPTGREKQLGSRTGWRVLACVRVHLQPSPICPNAGAGRLRACRGPGPHPPAALQSPRSRAGLLTTGANVYKSAFSLSNPPAGRCLLFSSSNVSDLMRDGVSLILVCDQSSQNHEVSSTHGNTNLS